MSEPLPMREQIARIIDPDAFRSAEERANEALTRIAGIDLDERSQRIGRREHDKRAPDREGALAKADAILALIAQAAGPEGGS